jgi:hypothetical protein
MKRSSRRPSVPLFPFLSVLLSTMGVLAFLSISFMLMTRVTPEEPPPPREIEFEWVGAPEYMEPVFIRCYADRVEYYDLFTNEEKTISLDDLLLEVQGKQPQLITYLLRVDKLNKEIKRNFGTTEHYPLLLIYPDGVLASEVLTSIVEQIEGLNVGLEPMLPHWRVPYQSM